MRRKLIGKINNSNPDAIYAQELSDLIESEKQLAFRMVGFVLFFIIKIKSKINLETSIVRLEQKGKQKNG